MPKFKVEESIDINATANKVRSAIQDYQQWPAWSPWLCMEPEASLQYEQTAATIGHAYSWEGDMVGAGRMEFAEIDGDIDRMDLAFLRPFKSQAKVEFETTELDTENTRVTWRMDSSLPFFLFFMVGKMKSMIGMDYDRGLKMLKEYIETGTVTSKTEVAGIVEMPAIPYVGVSSESTLKNISASMHKTIPKLAALSDGKTTQDVCGAIYSKMDITNRHCAYTVFAPVNAADATGEIASCKALKVVHTGDYQHLGTAWATANTYQRHHKIKANKNVHPFEIYTNDPKVVPAKDLVTEIYLPVNA